MVPPPFSSTVRSCFLMQHQAYVCSYAIRHIQPQSYHVGLLMRFPTSTQSLGRCNPTRISQPGRRKRIPAAGTRRGHKMVPAHKTPELSGPKTGPKNANCETQKRGQKQVRDGSLAIIIIRRARFWATVFWTLKVCPARPLFWGLKIYPEYT